jgi:uncharacterized membrane protein YuzA (DUF378 family)
MNARRRLILYIAIGIAIVMLLFAPHMVEVQFHETATNRNGSFYEPGGGYEFAFVSTKPLDFVALFIQFAILSLVTTAAMNPNRRRIIYVSIGIATVMILFPPIFGSGHQFLLDDHNLQYIDFGMLFIQFALLTLATAASWIATRKKVAK